MNEVSLQNDDVRNKFRTLYLEGKEYKEINEIMGIPQGTFDSAYYRNTHSLRDWANELKKERTMRTCEAFSKKLMAKEAEDNAKMIAIQQKEAEFLRETLLKDTYSKRIETIGFNINKNEPLDDEQKQRLDKLIKTSGNKVRNVEYTPCGEQTTPQCSDGVNSTEETPIDTTTDNGQGVNDVV